MLHLKKLFPLVIGLFILLPAAGLSANGLPEWQARAAEALDLINEAGLANWRSNLPLLWSEPDAVRRLLAPKVREEKLNQAYLLLDGVKEQTIVDNRVYSALAVIEAYRGDRRALEDLARVNLEGRQDLRLEMLDYALYLRDWDLAAELAANLEAEGVQPALTYRRAVLAGLTGNYLLADSLWREAVKTGLPITQAVYKELYKAGIESMVTPPTLHSKLRGYLETLDFLKKRSAPLSPVLLPDGLRNGISAYETGAYREAVKHWQSVAGPADLRLIAQCMIGQALNRLGEYNEAVRLWDEIVKTNPGLFLGYMGQAEAYRGKGQRIKADHCLQTGFRRTDSLFLLKNNAISPNILREARAEIRDGATAGYVLVRFFPEETRAAEGFWISWNYGRDWLWYPNYLHPFSVPTGNEYWIKATGTLPAPNYPEQILREKTPIKPEIKTPLTVKNTGFGENPSVQWEWSAPVALQFEYWSLNGVRVALESSPQTLHVLELANAAPGREYRYRAYVTRDGQEIAVVEGSFTTDPAPFWVEIAKPVVISRTGQIHFGLIPDDWSATFRWAENKGPWSEWKPVKARLILNFSPEQGRKELNIQFKDRLGRQSPILRENVNFDKIPPRIGEIQRRTNSGGNSLTWQTDEPSIATVWYRTAEKGWQSLHERTVYSQKHSMTLPLEAVEYRIWAEDRGGNISEGPQGSWEGIRPISLRINGGEEWVAERNVLLALAWTGEKSATARMRFSNDGAVWGSWNPLQETFSWRLTGGNGEKTVYAQVRDGKMLTNLQSTIRLEQKKIALTKLEFSIMNEGKSQAAWHTSEPARCRLYYGKNPEGMNLIEGSEYRTQHHALLGAIADGRYLWRLEAQDRAGNRMVWKDGWFLGQNGVQKLPEIEWEALQTANGQNLDLHFRTVGMPPAAMRLRNREKDWTRWMPFETHLRWSLMPVLEKQWIEAQFKDGAGVVSPVYTLSFSQDIRPSRVYGVEIRTGPDGSNFVWKSEKKVRGWLLVQVQTAGVFKDLTYYPGPDWAFEGMIPVGKLSRGVYRMRLLVQDSAGNWNGSNWATCVID